MANIIVYWEESKWGEAFDGHVYLVWKTMWAREGEPEKFCILFPYLSSETVFKALNWQNTGEWMKIPNFHFFQQLGNLKIQPGTTFKYPDFQSLFKFLKKVKYFLIPKLKNLNLQSMDEFG